MVRGLGLRSGLNIYAENLREIELELGLGLLNTNVKGRCYV